MLPSLSKNYRRNHRLSGSNFVGNRLLCHSTFSHSAYLKYFAGCKSRVPNSLAEYPEHARQAHESVSRRCPMRYSDFMRFFGDWECLPINVDGKPVGALLNLGPEIHACVNGGYGLWATKPVYQRFRSIVKEHGRALTSVMEGNTIGEAFVKRLGFKETSRANGVVKFEVSDGD